MASNEISLYRQIGTSLIEEAGIRYELPELFYVSTEGEMVEMNDLQNNDEVIEVRDDNWAPQDNNLIYTQKFIINNPSALFGTEKVTDSTNKLGLAAHIYSKTSFFQETLFCDGDIVDSDDEQIISFKHTFDADTLRGQVYLDFFIYLKEVSKKNDFQASLAGTNLCQKDIYKAELLIDGEGSVFPITENEIPGGPLWSVKKLWVDPSVEAFDTSSVQIEVNKANPLLEQAMNGKTHASAELMSQILLESISLIISQTLDDMEKQDLKFEDATEGSVLAIVEEWIRVYNIQTDNMMTIFNSLQNSDMHRQLIESGDEEDND